MPTFSCKFNQNHCFSSLWKVDIAGITGPVQFDENGRRIVSRLEIFNLRNDSFKRVSSMKAMNNPILFSSDLVFWKRKTLDWISTTIDIRKGFFKRVGSVDLNHPVLLSALTSWGARVAQWWERSPPTNVARFQLPASTPYVGWVCCGFHSGFPLFSKTNISKFQFDQESGRRRTAMWMCYLQIVIYLFIYLILRLSFYYY